MRENEQFFCACCGQMHALQEAKVIFRTGFFRNIYPLGYCKNGQAAQASWSGENAATGNGTEEDMDNPLNPVPFGLPLIKHQPSPVLNLNSVN